MLSKKTLCSLSVAWYKLSRQARTQVKHWNKTGKGRYHFKFSKLFVSLVAVRPLLSSQRRRRNYTGWASLCAKQRQNACSWPPVYQELSTHHDWPVTKAIVDLPISLRGNSKGAVGNSLSLMGPRTTISALLHRRYYLRLNYVLVQATFSLAWRFGITWVTNCKGSIIF